MERLSFLLALSNVEPAINPRPVNEFDGGIFIQKGKGISALNENLFYYSPLDISVERNLIVSYSKTKAVLSGFEDKEISISSDSKSILMKSETTTGGIPFILSEERNNLFLETIALISEDKFKPLDLKFLEAISICSYTISNDIAHRFLNNICIEETSIRSSDGVRVSRFNVLTPGLENKQVLFMGASARLIVAFAPTDIYIQRPNWMFFKNATGIMGCRLQADEYPDAGEMFDVKGIDVTLPIEITDLMRAADSIIDQPQLLSKKVHFNFSKNKIQCKVKDESGTWLERKYKIEYSGENFSIVVNPVFIKEILEHSQTMIVDIKGGRALFKTESFEHVIALWEE